MISEIQNHFAYTLTAVSAAISFLVVNILLLGVRSIHSSRLILASVFLIMSFSMFSSHLVQTGLIREVSWIFGWEIPVYYLLPTLLYQYLAISMRVPFTWNRWYLLMLSPAIIGLADAVVFYFLPYEERVSRINQLFMSTQNMMELPIGIIPNRLHFLLRPLHGLIIGFAMLGILNQVRRQYTDSSSDYSWKRMMVYMHLLVCVIYLFVGLALNGHITSSQNQVINVIILGGISTISFTITLIFNPRVLYPVEWLRNVESTTQTSDLILPVKSLESTKKESKNEENILRIADALTRHECGFSYLKMDFSASSLAAELGIPTHQLTSTLKEHRGKSFIDYKNRLRIQYAIVRIREGALRYQTTEALAEECGYASRSGFTKLFKELTGLTPADYARLAYQSDLEAGSSNLSSCLN